ncbi:APO protein 3, mitochondrial [Linum perenne]
MMPYLGTIQYSSRVVSRSNFWRTLTGSTTGTELPRKLKKSERKPWVTSVNELKRKARLERKEKQSASEQILRPPENGLLVKELIPVAHEVYAARAELLGCVSKVAKNIAVYCCSVCGEVHVGHPPHKIRTCDVTGSLKNKEHSWTQGGVEHIFPLVESFHLYDRLGRAVSHNEQLLVDRIPAVVELCIQSGVDIPVYPTRRRTFPAYSVAGRIIDFERRFPKEEETPGKDINTSGFWEKRGYPIQRIESSHTSLDNIQEIAIRGMKSWEVMRSGIQKLMSKYAVHTCGYCPEVQVGRNGHRVRNCQAYKHQMRDGQHGWQEATVDDLVPPVFVWHVRDLCSQQPMANDLRQYYGMLPAVVELFAQAGAQVGDNYTGLMREDVAVPELDELKLAV